MPPKFAPSPLSLSDRERLISLLREVRQSAADIESALSADGKLPPSWGCEVIVKSAVQLGTLRRLYVQVPRKTKDKSDTKEGR